MQLTDAEWEFIGPYLPIGEYGPYPERLRQQFEGVIWRFKTGGQWREIFNTDSSLYAGSNIGNGGVVWALDEPWAGQPHSLRLTVPPLAAVYLKPGA